MSVRSTKYVNSPYVANCSTITHHYAISWLLSLDIRERARGKRSCWLLLRITACSTWRGLSIQLGNTDNTVDGWEQTKTAQSKHRFSQYGLAGSNAEHTARYFNKNYCGSIEMTVTKICTFVCWNDQPLCDGCSHILTTSIKARNTILHRSTCGQGQDDTSIM